MDRNAPLQLISVDPGLNGTGIVYWRQHMPVRAGVLRPPRKLTHDHDAATSDDIARCLWIADGLFELGNMAATTEQVVIEMPEFQSGAGRQMGWKTGDLQKLTLLVGILAATAARALANVQLVTPSQWKGQLPKDVVQRRLETHYGSKLNKLNIQTHAWDALGIGAWALGQPWMKGR